MTVRIGVLCPSEIALRRFMPALQLVKGIEYAGIGMATPAEWAARGPADNGFADSGCMLPSVEENKAAEFQSRYGGALYCSYASLIADSGIDAVYVPLPPGLHAVWGREVLAAGKHLFMEKPFTTTYAETEKLMELSKARNVAVRENYMFAFHAQIEAIKNLIDRGEVGDVRLIRIDFGFPFRGGKDFRYQKDLGGGALLDCGGYALMLADMMLGEGVRVEAAQLDSARGLDVDVYGSAMLVDGRGAVAQISFGMDNDYRCSIDVWGSEGTLTSGRILTAPAGYRPSAQITRNGQGDTISLPIDDSFMKSIEHFLKCVGNGEERSRAREGICRQAALVEQVRDRCNGKGFDHA